MYMCRFLRTKNKHFNKILTENTGFQALIQYETRQSAATARGALQGRNVYDGYCQLDIQFSNIIDEPRSRDFTNLNLATEQKGRSSQSGYGDARMYGGIPGSDPHRWMCNAQAIETAFGGDLPPGITGTNERCTILVTNLNPDRIDEHKLFNLFSLYGNIVRIKRLRSKPDHALVQMGDGFQAELAVHFLKVMWFSNIEFQSYFLDAGIIHVYVKSSLNRFNQNVAKNYRYCCVPTKIIHMSTLPEHIIEEDIASLLQEHGTYDVMHFGKEQRNYIFVRIKGFRILEG
ncbi:putative nucleotide-binding alpha-beta plait domain-containing protein [Medicago truncatula]|uniref:Putative nucleotide-binding alpha-beta plait domain-containing protein n=1 Tax=Medicago truncatula TaxID=3880 RepID=A0A396HEX1_MEDTR|nr:putative nucleotide-binding alpha-beta plait domain-containing protein [Medicago truncatula]